MSCITNPIIEDQCLIVIYKGEPPVGEIMSARYFVNRYLARKRWNRIAVNIAGLQSRLTNLELVSLASDLSSELPSSARIALVVRPDQVGQARIVQHIARIENLSVAYFFTMREARDWLVEKKPLERTDNQESQNN